ncbi:MAG: hypothetical protein A3E85_02940 [Gammaproteobacteria bacterium RIFCSPHIGHO2_12_FULL_45_12]|nr:MAG: hypothetical protein A3E85_02940 [Gammaproteobacteria bacterium RIFCSPHIGHO2_12_FULL_45_12]
MNEKMWYDIWMKQSAAFFSAADENLFVNPSDNRDKMSALIQVLKNQWQAMPFPGLQKNKETYWQQMLTLCQKACDVMLGEWIKRTQEDNPIKDPKELYELWLHCCQSEYQKSLQSSSFQEAYGAMMNDMMQYWQAPMMRKNEEDVS